MLMALALLAALVSPMSLFAWNKPGHMVIGAIAYQVLKERGDDATIGRAVALLKQHLDFPRWEKRTQEVAAEDRDLLLFMHAARWPDDARGNPRFYPPGAYFDRLHYINLPYRPATEPDSVKIAAPDEINIIRGYDVKLALVKAAGDEADRAVALCWVLHLVGDVHQPLHTTCLFTKDFQQLGDRLRGDGGGIRFYIRAAEGKAPISLHQYWDDLLLGSEAFRNVKNRAIELRLRPDFAKIRLTELAVTRFEDWAVKESFELGKNVVYRNGSLEGSSQRNSAPPLPLEYAKTAQPIAERRAVLAGYRLAALLSEVLVAGQPGFDNHP